MANRQTEDYFRKLIEDIDNWDDGDLLLLNAEAGEVHTPKGTRKEASADFEPLDGVWNNLGEKPKKQKGDEPPMALVAVLLVLVLLVGGALVALKLTGGDLSKLAFWQTQQTETAEDDEDEEPVEETADEAEPEEAEETEESEQTETSVVIVEGEEQETVATASSDAIPLLQLWGEDFTPTLAGVNNAGVVQSDSSAGTLDYTAATYLEQFIAAARAAGYKTICTKNGKYVSAGTNATEEEQEHATGLAVDLIDLNNQIVANLASDSSLADEIAWWAEHAAEYGFVLRYPADKEEITGVSYNCYHFVFVTVEVAEIMAENNWCLEEYLESLSTTTE